MSCIIGRVDVDQFDFTEIAFLQELQDFQIIALNIEIFGGVPIDALLRAGAQGLADGTVGLDNGRFLAHPCKFIRFVALGYVAGKHLTQQVKVDRLFQLSVLAPCLRHAVRKKRFNLLNIALYHIRGFKFHMIH